MKKSFRWSFYIVKLKGFKKLDKESFCVWLGIKTKLS